MGATPTHTLCTGMAHAMSGLAVAVNGSEDPLP